MRRWRGLGTRSRHRKSICLREKTVQDDCGRIERDLHTAIRRLEADDVAELTDRLIAACFGDGRHPGVKATKTLLKELRRKRFFGPLRTLAEAFLSNAAPEGEDAAAIQIQLAQARIDDGMLVQAEHLLQTIRERFGPEAHAGREARGLLGRIRKQNYVDTPEAPRADLLRDAVQFYHEVYREPELAAQSWWHGINVVACLARAERDGILEEVNAIELDWKAEASTVLGRVSHYEREDGDYTFAAATAVEACIALSDIAEALHWCEVYIDAPFADVFELGSTERQLREVWQLDTRDHPGTQVLRLLQSALAQKGGSLELKATAAAVRPMKFEAQLGDDAAVAVNWLENLYARCRSVAWISNATDASHCGTGFFVRSNRCIIEDAEFPVPKPHAPLWLLTNHHVLNRKGERNAIRFDDAEIKLTLLDGAPSFRLSELAEKGHARLVVELEQFDFTLVAFDLPEILERYPRFGMPVSERQDVMNPDGTATSRLYVIGHPRGGVMKVSLYDNDLIDIDDPRLLYRSPTEVGNSGSPVLAQSLNVVAIHHATLLPTQVEVGDDETQGKRRSHAANAGVLIDAIARHLRKTETAQDE